MAGIFAVLDHDGARSNEADLLAAARAAPHRFGTSPRAERRGAFAWAIIDPTAALATEFSYHESGTDEGLVVVFHGRLDNRSALLRDAGHPPASCSDAELVFRGYKRSGRSFLASLMGNFAGLIRDPSASSLIAIRDPMWMRPLYYAEADGAVAFASEIKQIQAWDSRFHELDEAYIARFLANLDSPLVSTAFNGVRLVEPGRMVIFADADADAGGQSVHRTDSFSQRSKGHGFRRMPFEDAVERLRAILKEVAADVVERYDRIGIFLSGGTDSMGAAALAASHLRRIGVAPGDRLHAYCFDFTGFPDADERHISRQLTDLYGIPVTEIPVRDALPLSDLALADLDDPGIGVYDELFEYTCRVAAVDGMTAMLSGDRGDLIFGEMVYDLFGPLTRGNWKDFFGEMSHLAEHYNVSTSSYIARMARSSVVRMMESALPAPVAMLRRRRHRSVLSAALIPDWIQDDFRDRTHLAESVQRDREFNRWTSLKGKRLSMLRSPMQMRNVVASERTKARYGLAHLDFWSDARLIEFALSIPQHLITTPRYPKKLVRAALAPLMPEASHSITQKIYPTAVYDATVRSAAPNMSDVLSNMISSERGFVDDARLREVHQAMVRKEVDPPTFWRAVALERWLRIRNSCA